MSSIVSTELINAHWRALHELAMEAMTHAYAPYSRFKVGAAALVGDGRFASGCNVESAGHGVILCAEYGFVSELTHTGGGRLVAFACVDTHDRALAPCGRCRRFLSECATNGMVLAMSSGVMSIDEIPPDCSCTDDVERVVGPQS